MCKRIRGSARCALGLLLLVAATMAAGGALAADINVILDQAKLLKLPERVATIVVGNPLIADVALQSGGILVVTGKGYGVTNLIVLDRAGNVQMEKTVLVQGPRENVVVVHRGIERESYSCAPKCDRRITLGDSQTFFETAITQTGTRNTHSLGKEVAK